MTEYNYKIHHYKDRIRHLQKYSRNYILKNISAYFANKYDIGPYISCWGAHWRTKELRWIRRFGNKYGACPISNRDVDIVFICRGER